MSEASQAVDELQAAAHQAAPVALVPPNDPMTTVGADVDIIPGDFPNAGNLSVIKTDLYRAGVGQAPLLTLNPAGTATQYCTDLKAGGVRVMNDAKLAGEMNSMSPTAGMNLSTFMVNRFNNSLTLLNCNLFK